MAKKERKPLHKIRIHDNRWLAWTISLALLACIAMIGYIQVSDVRFERDFIENTSLTKNWATFRHKTDGYVVKYPRTWSVEAESGAVISLVSNSNPNDYFSVSTYASSQESSIKNSLFTTREEEVNVNGVGAVKISQSKTQAENVVMIRNGQKLFVLRGKGAAFDKILSSFKFMQTIE